MRVLTLSNLYPPDFIGGYEIACAHVVDALRARGHEVRVLTGGPRLPVADTPPHVLRRFRLVDEWSEDGMGAVPLAFRLDEAQSRLVSAHNIHVLTSVLEEFQPDVVYVCCVTGLGGLGLMACLQYLRVPWVWQLGDRVPHHLCSTRQQVIPGLAELFTRHVEGQYIVVSEQLRREIEDCRIMLRGNVDVLPYWINGQRGPRRQTFYQGGHLRIMSAGQVARWKGADVIIEAAARLRDAGHHDFSVDFYGKVHQHDLPILARKLGLADHVFFKGVLSQARLIEAYSQYDLFAFPTLEREPFGMVPLEAAARGCVPVITRRCGIAEWLVHGLHCLKADRTPVAFARAFSDVLERRIPLESLGRRGAELAWREFHLDAILPRIERLLHRASLQPRTGAGTPHEAYRLARMAEQLAASLIQEALCA